jgi:hypothetical protein
MYLFVDRDEYLITITKTKFKAIANLTRSYGGKQKEGMQSIYFVTLNETISQFSLASPSSDSFIIIATLPTYYLGKNNQVKKNKKA